MLWVRLLQLHSFSQNVNLLDVNSKFNFPSTVSLDAALHQPLMAFEALCVFM